MDNRVLLLFATTTKPQYHRDVMNVCCYPSSATVRFAYQNKWLPEEFRNTSLLERLPALVVLCESQEKGYKFHPLRWAIVASCQQTEDGFLIELELGKYESYHGSPEEIERRLSDFAKYIAQASEHPNALGKNRRFVCALSPWAKSTPTEHYLSAVRHFRKVSNFSRSCFVFVEKSSGGFGLVRTPPDGLVDKVLYRSRRFLGRANGEFAEYRLASGRGIDLELLSFLGAELSNGSAPSTGSPSSASPVVLQLELHGDDCVALGSMTRQAAGGGVLSRHLVRARPSNTRGATVMSVRCSDPSVVLPTLQTLIWIRPPVPSQILSAFLIAVAPTLATIPERGFEGLGAGDWWRAGSLAASAFGVWIALRRVKF